MRVKVGEGLEINIKTFGFSEYAYTFGLPNTELLLKNIIDFLQLNMKINYMNTNKKIVESEILKTATINPYREAFNMVFERFLWDIRFESWRSRYKIKKLKNRYLGQKAVILCNGPSLLNSDLSLLKNTFTFGLNKINLLFKKSAFRPSCIVAVNPLVIEQNASFYNHTEIQLFLNGNEIGSNVIRRRKNVIFLHSSPRIANFARDCSMTIFQGATVTYVAIELSFHMGFSEVAIIGCDHNFTIKGDPNTVVISGSNDPNHFDPNYFAEGVKWQSPDLLTSEKFYRLSYDVFNHYGRKLVNATEGGKLEILPRKSLESFIGSTNPTQKLY